MKSTTILSSAFVVASQMYWVFAISHAEAHGANHVVRDASRVIRDANLQVPSQTPVPAQLTSAGCYSSKGNLTASNPPVENLSSGSCNDFCKGHKFWVSGLQADTCYCGFAYPPVGDLAKDSSCNYPCPAYGKEACGGLGQPGFFSIWNTGININPPAYSAVSSSTTSSSTSTAAPTTSQSSSATTTQDPATTSQPSKGGSSTNVAGIAAGTVAGVVVLGGLIGAAFFLMRRRRNAEIEEEHRRNAAVNAFINGSQQHSNNGSISMTDSRLDPVLANRRLSDGSIADNEDYSRRILRVTNA